MYIFTFSDITVKCVVKTDTYFKKYVKILKKNFTHFITIIS